MKKALNVLLVLVMVFAIVGCSSQTSAPQKTENELKDQVNTEKEINLLTGKMLLNYVPMGVGIFLDTPITIDGREVEDVYFDDDVITDLVPRKYFTYYFEGGTSINADKYGAQIPIVVEVNPNSFDYYEDLGRTSAVITKVISIDEEQNPQDKTGDEYPLDYYKQVFYTLCEYNGEEPIPANIKDHYLYKNTGPDSIFGKDFKTAVDHLIENGYVFRQVEGEFSMELLSEADVTEVDLTLSAKKFLEMYPTDYVLTQPEGGYHGFDTIYEYPYTGLTVTYFHDEKDDLSSAYMGIAELTSYKNKIKGLDITIGMSLEEAYKYCRDNLENVYNRHADEYMDELFYFNDLVLALNDRCFGEYDAVKPEDTVEKITLYLMED